MKHLIFLNVGEVCAHVGCDPNWLRKILKNRTAGVESLRTKEGQFVIPFHQIRLIQELAVERKKRQLARVAGLEILEDLDSGAARFVK